MKYFVILLILIGIVSIMIPTSTYGLCISGTDWDEVPCWGRSVCTDDDPCSKLEWWQDGWTPYYNYKGAEWMEMKKTELLEAIKSGTLQEWKELTPNQAHDNVHDYYFYMGDVPNHNGIYVEQYLVGYFPPLKQFKSGVPVDEIQCKEELVLIQKHDGTPACVTYHTGDKLLERGWATCDDGIHHRRGHPCGVRSSPAIEGFDTYNQVEPELESESKSPKEIAIENIKESILTNTSYEQWRQTIQNEVDEKNLRSFSEIMLTDMKDKLEQDENLSFNMVNFGYRDWCLMPKISVYHQDYDAPIYEYSIVHTCPAPDGSPGPYIGIWDEYDFKTFPSCQFEGQYTIWGESFEFEPQVIGSFYCHSLDKFQAPETFEITIPPGSSDRDTKNNFIPFELELRYGDYIKIINHDDSIHNVILFVDKQSGSAVFGIRVNPNEIFTEPVYNLGMFDLASWDENDKEYPWMHGTVTVK